MLLCGGALVQWSTRRIEGGGGGGTWPLVPVRVHGAVLQQHASAPCIPGWLNLLLHDVTAGVTRIAYGNGALHARRDRRYRPRHQHVIASHRPPDTSI